MIEITRSLVRQFRTIVRQSLPPGPQRSVHVPTIIIESDVDGLHLRAHLGEVAVTYHRPNALTRETVVLPLTALQELEARTEEVITLEAVSTGTVKARWHEGALPRVRTFTITALNKPPAFPALPPQFTQLPVHFLKALDVARKSTARDAVRYSLNRLQLRGSKGEVVGTDGRQLLIQSGFELPWQEDVLIPALAAFGCRELTQAGTVRLGKTVTHVCLQVGPWTFFLTIDREGRYPRVEQVIPKTDRSATVCRLDAGDADFLGRNLARLVNPKDEDEAITLDLNGHVIVRSRPEGQERSTEVVLGHSTVTGPAVRLATNRRYLQRALELGLTEFLIGKPEAPVLAQRDGLRFVWMPLGKKVAVSPSSDAVHIHAPAVEKKPMSCPPRREQRKIRLRVPEPAAVQVAPVSASATTRKTPVDEKPRVLSVLRSLFTPRGWLWRSRKPR